MYTMLAAHVYGELWDGAPSNQTLELPTQIRRWQGRFLGEGFSHMSVSKRKTLAVRWKPPRSQLSQLGSRA